MTDSANQEPVVRSRRAILAAAAGGAAALAASAIGPASVAAVAAPMLTETDNAATDPTGVTNSVAGEQAFFGHAAGVGNGVEGTSVIGHGARGISSDTSDPANNASNAGVVGVAGDLGSIADDLAITGVYGYADSSSDVDHFGAGVWGDSPDVGVVGTGVVGVLGQAPFGVVGEAVASGGVGVTALSDVSDAFALQVIGRAEFSRSGRTTIAAGKSSRSVTLAGCTASTMVFAMLAANRSGRWVRAVAAGTGHFTIYLNTAVASNTLVAWIALTNPGNHAG